MTMKPDFIDGAVLISSSQITSRVDDLKRAFAEPQWVTTEQIMAALKITPSRSSATMIGHALRKCDGVYFKRTNSGRVFLFSQESGARP